MIPKVLLVLCGFLVVAAHAEQPVGEEGYVHILVTISDDGAPQIDLSGPPGPGYRRRDRYFASLTASKAAQRIGNDFGLVRQDDWLIRSLNVLCLVYAVPKDVPVADLLEQLESRPEVATAQRLNEFVVMARTSDANDDPYARLQHTIDTLELRTAHGWSKGRGVDIAVIDTGADFNHPDLKTQIAEHWDFAPRNSEGFVKDAHGTAVSGVIAAASGNGFGIIGVAPASRLSVLKACWYQHGRSAAICNSFSIAKALSHAIDEGADIINLSLAGPSDPLLAQLVDVARKRGIIVVAASPESAVRGFPANVAGVIVVDVATQAGAVEDRASAGVFAPGTDILVTMPDGRFDYLSGSSLAAAHVSGVVALLKSLDPALTLEEIVSLIVRSQQVTGDSINACRAIANLIERSGCRKLPALALTN